MFWIFAGLFFLVAVGLLVSALFQKKRYDLMTSTETATAAELRALATSVGNEIGAGSFNDRFEPGAARAGTISLGVWTFDLGLGGPRRRLSR